MRSNAANASNASITSLLSNQLSNSPIFPSSAFSPDSSFTLPEKQLYSSGGLAISIVLAEPVLFVQGFSPPEYNDRPPTLLRGSLIVRASKPTKIKTISLTFKGVARTDWPEGIPPKKVETHDSHELHSHTWPFFNASFPMAEYSSGAHIVRYNKESTTVDLSTQSSSVGSGGMPVGGQASHRRTFSGLSEVIDDNASIISTSPGGNGPRGRHNTVNSPFSGNNYLSNNRSSSPDSVRSVKGFASKFRRNASPATSSSATFSSSFSGLALGPHRSFSKDEQHDKDTSSKGYRMFEAGEYIYNFELPIPHSLPETMEFNFGSVKYTLEAVIERPGAFRSNISGVKDVQIIRCPSENNTELTEPIAISRSWEDQLYYEIVVGGKSFPIGTSMPIAFKLTPLDKVQCHRIRIYMTENCEYYCHNKKVHRIEPTRKYLLDEKMPSDGITGNLLADVLSEGELGNSTEMEFQIVIPETFPIRKDHLHADTAYENIVVHHWIKIVLRLSKIDPENAEKRKHYEISIDSPIHLLDNHCTNANVYLPEYFDPVSRRASIPRPVPSRNNSIVDGIGDITSEPRQRASEGLALPRPIHFLRKPSIAPPPFDADMSPPPVQDLPPNYETAVIGLGGNYTERYSKYRQQQRGRFGSVIHSSDVPIQPRQDSTGLGLGISQSAGSVASQSSSSVSNSTSSGSIYSRTSLLSLDDPAPDQPSSPLSQQQRPPQEQPQEQSRVAWRSRYQSTASVDIVDQLSTLRRPFGDSDANSTSEMGDSIPQTIPEDAGASVDPLAIRSVGSISSINPSSFSPKSSAGYSPLLGAHDNMSELTSIESSEDRDIGLGYCDDDLVSLRSTPSLWIS